MSGEGGGFVFQHTTVLLKEAVDGLHINPDGTYVDCTLGGGGHSEYLLSQLSEKGRLFAFDQDDMAIEYAKKRLARYEKQVTFIRRNFRFLAEELAARGVHKVDGILFDLGVSSPQLDTPERGFSYHHDAPLDMRMNREQPLTAYDIVNHWPYEKLVHIFFITVKKNFQSKWHGKSKKSAKKSELKQPAS